LGGVEKRLLVSPSVDLRSRRRTVTEDFEWADETCNPSEGCDKITPECEHCFAVEGDREQG
jgi:hypothetical protein